MSRPSYFSYWYRLGVILWAGWVGLLSPAIVLAAGQSNSQYVIDRDVVNAGGTTSTSTTYTLTGSIGQTSPLGSSSNPHYVLYAGFWHGKAYTLSVAKSGTGTGTVKDCRTTTDCPGDRINCGADCLDVYTEGDHVLLQAAPDAGFSFVRWLLDGAPITEPLYVTRDLTVTAVFQQACTLPAVPVNLAPANSAGNQPLTVNLAWADSAGAASYTVFFGSTTPPPQAAANLTAAAYAPGTLTANTTYSWRVDAVNACGTQPGPVWTFTTTHAPTITSTPPALTSYLYEYGVEATDADGDTLTYSLSGAPNDMAIDAATGNIIWAPNPLDIGVSYTTTVTVSDGKGGTASQPLPPLAITASLYDEEPPVVTVTLNRSEITLGESMTITLAASDNVGSANAQAMVNGSLVLTASGTTTYTPTTAGAYTVKASAQDAAGNTGVTSVQFWVRATTATIPYYEGFDLEHGTSEQDIRIVVVLPGKISEVEVVSPSPNAQSFLFSEQADLHVEGNAVTPMVLWLEPSVTAVILPNTAYNTVTAAMLPTLIPQMTAWTTGQSVTVNDTVVCRSAQGNYFKVGGFTYNDAAWTMQFNYEALQP